ncbi:chloroplast stem-loop binding protein of 41 kDa b, chloroplastic [Tanacetum coccineum]
MGRRCLDEEFVCLACEGGYVRCLATLVRSFKLIEVYIEHCVTILDSYLRAPRFRATLEDITDERAGSIAANKTKKILLTWHESSNTTKEPVCDSVTPSSLPQHDSSTPCKDSVCESIKPRCMPDCILTPPTDESNWMELDECPALLDVAGVVRTVRVSHDESFGVDDLDLNLNEPVNLNVSQVKTQSELPVSEEPDMTGGIEIVEPDVDVHLFGISMDLPFNNIGITNLVSDDVLEGEDVDVINVDGFDSDPGNDEERNCRKRRLAELRTEMEGVINASENIYLFGALKLGFRACKRDLLGLDGAFMKGPFPGQVLIAVRLNSNNGIYPLAYALVEVESKSSWCWFLQCLGDDIYLHPNSNFTFINDRQMGIIPAIKTIYPSAEHKYCLLTQTVISKQGWCGQEYKDLLWRAASATNVRDFEKCMLELKTMNPKAHEWFDQCRAKSDLLLNNICEVFNGKIVRGRDKPVITLLEYIREYCMKRIVNVQGVIDKCTGPLTPTTTRIMESIKKEAHLMKVQWNGANKYQVSGLLGDQCVVDVVSMTCSCRKWELTGIPCKHVVAACWNMALNDRAAPPLET